MLAVLAVLDGAARDLPDVNAPGYVGELELLHGAPRSATVVARSDYRVLRIPGADFTAALETAQPSLALIGNAGIRLARTSTPSMPPVQSS